MSNIPPAQSLTTAQRLRNKLLGQPVAPAQKVEIDGETYHIRTALLSDRTRIGEIAGMTIKPKDDGSIDMGVVSMSAMTAAALIVLAVDEVNNQLFTPTDLDALIATPAGGWVQQLGEKCLAASNGKKNDAPSVASPASASPSSSPTASSAPSPS